MRSEASPQIVGRADINMAVAQLQKVDVPHGVTGLPALLCSFGRSPYAFGFRWPATRSQRRRVAERKGFEPLRRFPAYTLSRRAPSTTRPSLRMQRAGRARVCVSGGQSLPERAQYTHRRRVRKAHNAGCDDRGPGSLRGRPRLVLSPARTAWQKGRSSRRSNRDPSAHPGRDGPRCGFFSGFWAPGSSAWR